MCGIAGHAGQHDPRWVAEMSRALAHRGPDGEGLVHIPARDGAAAVTLGHRRLSILDVANGAQPMRSPEDGLTIVFNGEIFNAPELRRKLESRGKRFCTANSDTEVLLKLYAEKGVDMLADLRGMFAFAIHDQRRERLFCARDRVGIKPFYYAEKDDRFAFASELKAFKSLPWVGRELDPESLYHYLSLQFVPAPGSIFKDVRKLPKGHWLIRDLRRGTTTKGQWWNLTIRPEERSREEWISLLRSALEEAVATWSLSDVPVACSLSGGLDSSIITVLAARGKATTQAFSLGFSCSEGAWLDELPLARLLAEKHHFPLHEFNAHSSRLLADLPRMVRSLDEPYAGGLPSWYIYEMVSREAKVVLTGTGGDELFGNYLKWKRFEDGPDGFARVAKSELKGWAEERRKVHAAAYPFGHYYPRYFSDAAKNEILLASPPSPGEAPTEALLQSLWERSGADNPRDAAAWIDFQLQLPEEFLFVADRFAMAHGVEARTPLLDHHLVELVYRIPASLRTGLDPKALMKEVGQDLLPGAFLSAPKRGFILPLTAWTRGELSGLVRELLSPQALSAQSIFAPTVWSEIVEPHLLGLADYTQQLWTLFMFQLWARERLS